MLEQKNEQLKSTAVNELAEKLTKAGIDVAQFGIGEAKSIEQLQSEIDAGETVFITEGNELIRCVNVVSIDVYHETTTGRVRLREDRQEFPDGRVRTREYMYGAVSEKMLPSESVQDAIARALQEEIGVSQYELEWVSEPKVDQKESPSYPGIKCRYTNYEARVLIGEHEYRDSYTEEEGGKTTYFNWVD